MTVADPSSPFSDTNLPVYLVAPRIGVDMYI